MIKIVPSGDYVQLKYVDTLGEYVQEELKSDADAIEYSSDSSGKIYLKFGRRTFDYFDPTEFEIDGSAVTDAADFITKLTALFSGGGSGGSSLLPTSGIGTATGDIVGDLSGNNLNINQGSTPSLSVNDEGYVGVGVADSGYLWSVINPSTNDILEKVDIDGGESLLGFINPGDNTFRSFISFTAPGGDDGASFSLTTNGNSNQVSINGNTAAAKLTYNAVNHVFPDLLGKDFADDTAAAVGLIPVGALSYSRNT